MYVLEESAALHLPSSTIRVFLLVPLLLFVIIVVLVVVIVGVVPVVKVIIIVLVVAEAQRHTDCRR